jgi:hypothetical protein
MNEQKQKAYEAGRKLANHLIQKSTLYQQKIDTATSEYKKKYYKRKLQHNNRHLAEILQITQVVSPKETENS